MDFTKTDIFADTLPTEIKDLSFLIIDDMSFYLSLLQQSLVNIGHTGKIYSAKNVQTAILKVNEVFKAGSSIDFIISDYNLTDSTGVDLVKKLRANNALKNIPLILFTTEDNVSKIIGAIEAGVDDYFFKPINEKVLCKKIINVYIKRQNQNE
jgi:two-component system chemotaxis response regulator CheY